MNKTQALQQISAAINADQIITVFNNLDVGVYFSTSELESFVDGLSVNISGADTTLLYSGDLDVNSNGGLIQVKGV